MNVPSKRQAPADMTMTWGDCPDIRSLKGCSDQ